MFESQTCKPLRLVLYVATLELTAVLPAVMVKLSLRVAQLPVPVPVLAEPPVISYLPVPVAPPADTVTVPLCAAVTEVSPHDASKVHEAVSPGCRAAISQLTFSEFAVPAPGAVLKVTVGVNITGDSLALSRDTLKPPLTLTVCVTIVLPMVIS